MSVHFAGLSLGMGGDYSALALLERKGDPPAPRFDCRHLRRWQPGTPYAAIAAEVREAFDALPPARHALALDVTGVGLPVVRVFRDGLAIPRPRVTTIDLDDERPTPPRPSLRPAFITGAEVAVEDSDAARVPKRELVSVGQLALQEGRLKIAPQLREADTLTRELQKFRVTVRLAESKDSELWREGAHDGLVFALCLALWQGSKPPARGVFWA